MNKAINIFGEKIEFECMGCDIANHKLVPPGGYVYDDGFINVSADPEIPINGFVVLRVNKHVKSLNDLVALDKFKVIEILDRTIRALKEVEVAKEVFIIQEETADHFHIWIVPVYDWMKEYGKSVRNISEMIEHSKRNFNEEKKEELLETIEKLKEYFSNN